MSLFLLPLRPVFRAWEICTSIPPKITEATFLVGERNMLVTYSSPRLCLHSWPQLLRNHLIALKVTGSSSN